MAQAAARRERERHKEAESQETEQLLAALADQYGYDFRDYARASLTRRVRKMLEREELASVGELQQRLLDSPDAMNDFVELVGVHTTAMFRDPEFYRAIRAEVVPLLRTYPFVRIWHAGCATGEEVYSLAIVLVEEGIYDRCRLYATDLSDSVLDRAKRGIYTLASMRGYTSGYQQSGGNDDFSAYYVADHKNAILRHSLRKNIIFGQHNLASDAAFNEFHLVLCRNVGIYFNQRLRERMHELIYRSLVPFGILGLGKKESLRSSGFSERYQELEGDARLFRKLR